MPLTSEHGLKWGTTDLSNATHGLRVMDILEQPRNAKPRVYYHDLAAADGGVSFSATKGPYRFRFKCAVVASSAADRATFIANIITAFVTTSPHTSGTQQLVLGWDDAYYYNANLDSELDFDEGITGATFELAFLVPNPVKVAL